MFKTNEYYLKEMIEDLDFIIEQMQGKTQNDLETNPLLSDSMAFRLIQISEISKNLADEYKEKHADIPWPDIMALRNRLVHDYGNVDMRIVYDTLTVDVADLKEKLSQLV